MFSEQERKVFRFVVGGKERFADPLAVRRELLRASAGQFDLWRIDSVEPDAQPAATDGARSHTPDGAGQAAEISPQQQIEEMRRAGSWLMALDAQEKVLACVRRAFGLDAFDPTTGGGCTEDECMAVLEAFDGWMEKNVNPAAS